ncbi:hypothetical protein EsDP_00007277 [Epichloe bromicola]|uniref:Uncharacterized protein n=1 Tax=Epichloe bromicola TaxID=79588 RepID=A0ABQ0D046_9HYPO
MRQDVSAANDRPIPVEFWLDHVQESTRGDGIADTAGPCRSQSRIDESGAFHLPLQDQDDPVGELRHGRQTLLVPRKRAPSERSGDAYTEGFDRKPRRKTRHDRYDRKNKSLGSDGSRNRSETGVTQRAGRRSRHKNTLRSGRDVMNNFTSESVCRDHLIMKPREAVSHHPPSEEDACAHARKAVADLLFHDFDLGNDDIRRSHLGTTQLDLGNKLDPAFPEIPAIPAHHSQPPESYPSAPSPIRQIRTSNHYLTEQSDRGDEGLGKMRAGITSQTNAFSHHSDVHNRSCSGRITLHGPRPMSREHSQQFKDRLEYPSRTARCEPQSLRIPISYLDHLAQDMTHDDIAKSREHMSRGSRLEIPSSSKLFIAEQPLRQPSHKTVPFDGQAQHRKEDVPNSEIPRPLKRTLTTVQARNTASARNTDPCIDLGEGHSLDFGRLRNRSFYRVDRVPLPEDSIRDERQIPPRRWFRDVDNKGDADDSLRRRFSWRPGSVT